jgi:hypothetical protein
MGVHVRIKRKHSQEIQAELPFRELEVSNYLKYLNPQTLFKLGSLQTIEKTLTNITINEVSFSKQIYVT